MKKTHRIDENERSRGEQEVDSDRKTLVNLVELPRNIFDMFYKNGDFLKCET